MASKARRISNNAGSANSFLNAVDKPNKGETTIAKAIAVSGKNKDLVQAIMLAVKQCLDDSDEYQKKLDSKSIDVTLGRIATLLDESGDSFAKNELEAMKKEILDEISGLTSSNILKTFLFNQISSLFDNSATKDDIEELKKWMSNNGISQTSSNISSNSTSNESSNDELTFKNKIVQSLEDEEEGDYKDSTNAKNFMALQTYIEKQFDNLNKNMKNVPGRSGIFSKMFNAINAGFNNVSKLTTGVVKKVGSAVKGIGNIGKKVGGAIASPFKKIGGFFSSLNPFARSQKKDEERKQRAKDKIMDIMAKVINKLWKVIEPFIDKVKMFMLRVTLSVIVPIAIIMAKVLLIVAAITAISAGLVLAYVWIKKKISEWINYFSTGQWWEDLKEKMSAAWEWTKDFGKWLWDVIVDALKYIFVDMWVDLGEWIWEKLCDFGDWLYDNYINPYIIEPFNKYIWEPIQNLWNKTVWPTIEPFVNSLTELKDKIVKAFSAWDTNKSIWENLKNISGIIKDAVVEWWNNSPFKKFYEKYLEPFVKSAGELFEKLKDLGGAIKKAILDWWNGDSSLADTLKNIGTTVWNTVKEWWRTSIFKTYWDKLVAYLDDLLKPLREWYDKSKLKEIIDTVVTSIKTTVDDLSNLWTNFKKTWDEFDLMKTIKEWYEQSTIKEWIDKVVDFGKAVKDAVVEWYEKSTIKEWVDKVVDFGKAVKDSVVEWYDNSDFKKWVDKVVDFGKAVKDAVVEWWENTDLYKTIQDIQTMGFWEWFKEQCGQFMKNIDMAIDFIKGIYEKIVGKIKKFITGVDDSQLAENNHGEDWGKIPDAVKNANSIEEVNKQIDRLNSMMERGVIRTEDGKAVYEKSMAYLKRKQQQLVAQQVKQATQPIQSLEEMKNESNVELKKTGEDINRDIAIKEQNQQQFNAASYACMAQLSSDMKAGFKDLKSDVNNPYLLTMPYMVNSQDNPATMRTF